MTTTNYQLTQDSFNAPLEPDIWKDINKQLNHQQAQDSFNARLEPDIKQGMDDAVSSIRQAELANASNIRRTELENELQSLNDVYLSNVSPEAKARIKNNGRYSYLVSNSALMDVDGQDLLMGGELEELLSNGDTFHALDKMINAMPKEQQLNSRKELMACKRKLDGTRLLGRMSRLRVEGNIAAMQKQQEEQKKVAVANQQILNSSIKYAFDNKGEKSVSSLNNKTQAAFALSGIKAESVDKAARAYGALKNESGRDRYNYASIFIGEDEFARKLLIDRLQQDGSKNPISDYWPISFAQAVGGGAIDLASNLHLPTYAQPIEERLHLNKEQIARRNASEDKAMALKHELDSAYDAGRKKGKSMGADITFDLTTMVFKAAQAGNPWGLMALLGENTENNHGRVASAGRGNANVSSSDIRKQAGIYGLVETAAFKGTSMAFFGRAYKSVPLLQKAAARVGVTRAGAFAGGAAFTVLDDTAMTLVELGVKGLYDELSNVPEELRFAGQEFDAWVDGFSDPKTMITMGLFYALGGASSTPAIREISRKHRVAKVNYDDLGGKVDDFDASLKIADFDERNKFLAGRLAAFKKSDYEGWAKNVAGAAKKRYEQARLQKQRGDAALSAAMKVHGWSEGMSDKDGKVRIYHEGESRSDGTYDEGTQFIDLDREDADAFIGGYLHDKVQATANKIKDLYARDATIEVFLDSLSGDVRVEKILGGESIKSMNANAFKAQAHVNKLMAEGMSEAEAKGVVAPELSPNLTLGIMIDFPSHFAERIETERQRGGDTGAPLTQAYVVTQFVGSERSRQRILRMSHDASLAQMVEELAEQSMAERMEIEGIEIPELYRELAHLREWMRSDKGSKDAADSFLGLDDRTSEKVMTGQELSVTEEEAVRRAVVEGTSKLFVTDLFARSVSGDTSLPVWASDTFASLTPLVLELERDAALASAIRKAREMGQFDSVAGKLINATQADFEAALAAKAKPEESDYLRSFRAYSRDQAAYDAMLGAGVATAPAITQEFERKALDGQEAIDKQRADDELENADDEHLEELEGEGLSHEEAIKKRAEDAADAGEEANNGNVEAIDDDSFSSGRCVAIEDEQGLISKSGMIAVDKLSIMPNFKLGADADGVVQALTGDYRPDHDPIRVWKRVDGSLMVISGRHRLDAAKRAGVSRIMSYLYDESPKYNEAWAKRFDVESNIRDNQATALEVALYVRGEFSDGVVLTDEQALKAGLARKGTLGAIGFLIGRRAGESVMNALRNGKINDRDALDIANFIPYNDEIQAKGLAMILDGASRSQVIERMAAEAALKKMQADLGVTGETDLFGNALDNEDFMRFVANYVTRKQTELKKDATYLNATVGRKTSPAMAKRYGVDIKDPDALKKARAEVDEQRVAWKTPYTNEQFMNEIRESWGKDNLNIDFKGREGVDFSLSNYKEKDLASVKKIYGTHNPTLKQVDRVFSDVIDYSTRSGLTENEKSKYLPVSPTPAVLQMLGVKAHMIGIAANTIKKITISKHNVSIEQLRKLPSQLSDPIAIFNSATFTDSYVILTTMTETINEELKPVIAAIHIDKKSRVRGVEIHKIASIYGRTSNKFFKENSPCYIKKSLLRENNGSWLQLPTTVIKLKEGSTDNIKDERDLVNYKKATRIDFSLGGMQAKTATHAIDQALTFIDPADGKQKFFIDSSKAKLKGNFRIGELTSTSKGSHKDTTLKSLLDFPALYEAYPELSDMRVRIYNPVHKDGCYGYFCPPQGEISAYIGINISNFNKNNMSRMLNTLVHESQHAIQQREGHSGGAGFSSFKKAQNYVNKAIRQREEKGSLDDWGRDNLIFLNNIKQRLLEREQSAIWDAYYLSRGEQEAREAGTSAQEGVAQATVEDYTSSLSPQTISVAYNATELGGLVYAYPSSFEHLINRKSNYVGEFDYDRRLLQMRESVMRRSREISSLASRDDSKASALAYECLSIITDMEKLLPDSYGFALEPYKMWLAAYSNLAGTGQPSKAAGMIPMKAWQEKIHHALYKELIDLIAGRLHRKESVYLSVLDGENAQAFSSLIEPLRKEYLAFLDEGVEKYEKNPKRARRYAAEKLLASINEQNLNEKLFKLLGAAKMSKVMSKFLDRAVMQLDRYLKDKKLGQIRRVLASIMPTPSKDGRPIKGRVDVETYNHAIKLMRLLELTKSEKIAVEEKYNEMVTIAGKDGDSDSEAPLWDTLHNNAPIEIQAYDGDGKMISFTVTKQEFDVYSCYELMSASQAESVSKAIGEFISTGRQAWDNAIEAQRVRITDACMPTLKAAGNQSRNARNNRLKQWMRKLLPTNHKIAGILGWMFNDAQLLDMLESDEATRELAQGWSSRLAHGKVFVDKVEKDTTGFLARTMGDIFGKRKRKDVVKIMNSIKETKKTGIVLEPVAPDFAADALDVARNRVMRGVSRKLKKKNARPNLVVAMIEYIAEKSSTPQDIAKELRDKYGAANKGQERKLKSGAFVEYDPKAAFESVLTADEQAFFGDIEGYVHNREDKLHQDWKKKQNDAHRVDIEIKEESLDLSQVEAAYLVALCDQEDLSEGLRMQGFSDAVIAKLEAFAGDKVMELMRSMRDELNYRTPEIKAYYERQGMPFPEVKDYFRAFFNVGFELESHVMLDGHGVGNAAGGGIAKILYTRRKHNAEPALGMDIFHAFICGMKEQTNLLAYGELASDMAAVLNYKSKGKTGNKMVSMRDSLQELWGVAVVRNLESTVKNLSQLAPAVEMSTVSAQKIARAFTSASAVSYLSWYAGTLFKQPTAIFNTLHGVSHISFTDWMRSMSRMRKGSMKISLAEMKKQEVIASRFAGFGLRELQEGFVNDADVKGATGRLNSFHRRGMDNLSALDRDMVARSAQIMYDASYHHHEKSAPGLDKDAYHALAMEDVTVSVSRKSQPMDWRSGSLFSTERSLLKVFSLFLGGESINTVARVLQLAAKGEKKKAAQFWLTHGVALQALTCLFNLLTDDEEKREERNYWAYVANSLMGPAMGIPVVGGAIAGLANAGVRKVINPFFDYVGVDIKLPAFYASGLVPLNDVARTLGRVDKIVDADTKFSERVSISSDIVTATAILIGTGFSNPSTPQGAAVQATALGAAAIGNVVEFLTKTGVNAYELLE